MEKKNTSGIIIEFVGPPGAGKTTITNLIIQKINADGLVIKDFPAFKKYFHRKGLAKKTVLIIGNTISHFRTLMSYIALLSRAGIFNLNSWIRYFKLFMFQSVFKEYIEHEKADILILDQWSVQQLWSATIFRAKNYDVLEQNISKFYYEPDLLIYLNVDTKEAISRIGQRMSGKSRFDKMEGDNIDSSLKAHGDYLKKMYDQSKCPDKIVLSGMDTPERNADVIITYLKKNLLA